MKVRPAGLVAGLAGVAGVAALAALAGCSVLAPGREGAMPVPVAPRPGSSLSWRACGAYECATVDVPLDYARPGGPQIPIALSRLRASGPNRIGSLLVDPGGPGASGTADMGLFTSILSSRLLSRFDLVAFDPRGVGKSAGVRCLSASQLDQWLDLDPVPSTPASVQASLAAARTLAAGCQAQAGSLLPFVGTANAARDMERIRFALGDAKLTYLGFSYGSALGAAYAEEYPTHIRAMALDGAVDPALDPVALDTQQAVGFQQELDAFLASCTVPSGCAWTPGGDLHAAFEALMASIRAHPLQVGTRHVGPGEAFLGVVTPLYDRGSWPALANALEAASTGDGAPLLSLSDRYAERDPSGQYSDTLEANVAITCADQSWPADPQAYAAPAAAAAKAAPDFGAANIYSNLPCAVWPYRTTATPHPVRAPGSPPIVIVGTTGDPATPYAWAQSLAGQLPHGFLVTRRGEGHTGYETSTCVLNDVDDYLIDLTLPPAGATCTS